MAVLVFLVYFYTVLVTDKTKFITKSARKYATFSQNLPKNFLGREHSPVGKGTPPLHTPPPLAPSAPRLGSRLWFSTLAPNFNSWIQGRPSRTSKKAEIILLGHRVIEWRTDSRKRKRLRRLLLSQEESCRHVKSLRGRIGEISVSGT